MSMALNDNPRLVALQDVLLDERPPLESELDLLVQLGYLQVQHNRQSGQHLWWWTIAGDEARRKAKGAKT